MSPIRSYPLAPHLANPHSGGFTLVELLVALAVLAIVAGIALPIYSTYSDRSYRGEAQSDLLMCAQGMERWASNNFDYLGAADANGDGTADTNTGTPAVEICRPKSVIAGRYTVAITVATATTFTLRATPAGPMAGDGFMTIDQSGQQAWDENNNGSIGAGENTWQE